MVLLLVTLNKELMCEMMQKKTYFTHQNYPKIHAENLNFQLCTIRGETKASDITSSVTLFPAPLSFSACFLPSSTRSYDQMSISTERSFRPGSDWDPHSEFSSELNLNMNQPASLMSPSKTKVGFIPLEVHSYEGSCLIKLCTTGFVTKSCKLQNLVRYSDCKKFFTCIWCLQICANKMFAFFRILRSLRLQNYY